MEFCTKAEFRERWEHLLDNLLCEKSGGIAPREVMKTPWMEKLTHMMEECVLRGYAFPGPLRSPSYKPFAEGFERFRLKADGVQCDKPVEMYKYGKAEHLEQLLSDGIIRISAASSYSDSTFNHAVSDDEIQRPITLNRHNSSINLQYGNIPIEIVFDCNFKITLKCETDYYISCYSTVLESRLFHDFNADAVLLIHDNKAFVKKLRCAFSEQIGTGFVFRSRAVDYLDPLLANGRPLIPELIKHFKFAYQAESRLLWKPKKPQERLEGPHFIKCGSLNDIASLVSVD